MNRISIVDIIDHKSKYAVQRLLVVNRRPKPVFEREGQYLIGDDAGFWMVYKYETPGPNWKAFAGRKFDIPMKDGSTIKADGQWWSSPMKCLSEMTYNIGAATVESLSECHVFFGTYYVDRKLVDDWLQENEPSNNYDKYNPKHADFGKHRIVSRWETANAT